MSIISEPKGRWRTGSTEVAALIDWVAASHTRTVALLIVLSLAAYLPGLFQIPPVDRDEARFAQATKQMIETGDYVDIRFQEEARYKKPVGIYWLQAAVVEAAEALGVPQARTRIGLYRIPSVIGATAAVVLTYWAALAFVSRRAALLAGLMMATSLLLGVEARLAKTDAVLLLAMVAAMGAMARAYLRDQGDRVSHTPEIAIAAIFWTAVAVGIMIKGPVILMVAGLAAATLVTVDRSAHWLARLKPLLGIAWTILLVLPWFIAILVRSGGNFFSDSLGDDLFAKVAGGQETHGLPPGFYFVAFWETFFPGAMLAGLAAPAVWRARSEPGAKFLLAWVVPSWIVFELVPTKLPHYVLPLYPAIAILIAGVMDGHALSRNRWLIRGTVWWFLLMVVTAAALIGSQVVVGQRLGILTWIFAAAAIIFALFAWLLYRADGAETSLVRAATASIMLSWAAYGATIPVLRGLFPAVGLASYMHSTNCADPVAASVGFHEPSLVFLAGTGTILGTASGAADFLLGGTCRFAFVDSRQERAFAQRAEEIGLRYSLGPRIDGFAINGGQPVVIATFRSEPAP
jgi:4-amino-4-deoxy-L-arabinose transferase-like glycosyltransferase